MPDQNFDYASEFQAKPKPRRWWPKAIIICAVLGGIYGAAIRSAISTTAGAVDVIGICAAIMAVLFGVPGARFGFFLGILNRWRFGRLALGMLATMGGAILGGFLGLMAVMPLGAILGGVGGWVFVGAMFRGGGWLWRLQWQVLGLVLGACIGVTALALSQSPSAALLGIAWGLGIGVVIGPLPLLLFAKMMDSLAPKRDTHDKIIDVEVKEVHDDES